MIVIAESAVVRDGKGHQVGGDGIRFFPIETLPPGTEIDLLPGTGGVFEVSVDGKCIFSKKKEGRFPSHEEILAHFDAR